MDGWMDRWQLRVGRLSSRNSSCRRPPVCLTPLTFLAASATSDPATGSVLPRATTQVEYVAITNDAFGRNRLVAFAECTALSARGLPLPRASKGCIQSAQWHSSCLVSSSLRGCRRQSFIEICKSLCFCRCRRH